MRVKNLGNSLEVKRNLSIELLRCFLMVCIVAYHAIVHGHWKTDVGQWQLHLFAPLLMWHVPCFVAISGWFGIRFSWSKFLRLWGVCVFYTALSVAWTFLFDRTGFQLRSIIVSGGWFVGTYMMLMFLAPLLDEGVASIAGRGREFSLRIWLVFASGVFLQWFPLHAMSGVHAWGEDGGYTLSMMVFVYVTARLARSLGLTFNLYMLGGAAFLFVLGVLVFGGTQILIAGGNILKLDWKTSYDAPHVWLFSIMVVVVVTTKLRVNRTIGRIAGFVAPSVLGIYLFHDTTSFGRLMIRAIESYFSNHTGLPPFVIVVLTAFAVFSLALSIDFVRRALAWLAGRSVFSIYYIMSGRNKVRREDA